MILDDDELEKEKLKNKKLRSIIILSIIILSILIVVLVGLIYYKMQHPSYITTYIDGSLVQNFDKIIDIQIDENGKTQFYIPIRAFATYLNKVNSEFGYQDYDGEYVTVRSKNYFAPGDKVEIISPDRETYKFKLGDIYDSEGNKLDASRHPENLVKFKFKGDVRVNDMLRISLP